MTRRTIHLCSFIALITACFFCKSPPKKNRVLLGQETAEFKQLKKAYAELERVFLYNLEKLKIKCSEIEAPAKMLHQFWYSTEEFGEYKCFKSTDFRVVVNTRRDITLRDHLRLIREKEVELCWQQLCDKVITYHDATEFYQKATLPVKSMQLASERNYYSQRRVIYYFNKDDQKVKVKKNKKPGLPMQSAVASTGRYSCQQNRLVFFSRNTDDRLYYHEGVIIGAQVNINVFDQNFNFIFYDELRLVSTN